MTVTLYEPENILDRLLREQGQLTTAVEQFSHWHETRVPAQGKYYQKLIPLKKPGLGEQYGFKVDLDACSGCKACVTACHNLNGLHDEETWRDVGLLVGAGEQPYQQTITAACHHCADPGCANGCPVLAYEKDSATGIVRHLDDQCIGCQYCILKCPYDVPKYNDKLGIVRKCDMCYDRLAADEAPACVQACPHEAISIQIVKLDEVKTSSLNKAAVLVPGVYSSAYTKPTTQYISNRLSATNVAPVGTMRLEVEEGHLPLVGMLVLTQMAAGSFTLSFIQAVFGHAAGIWLTTVTWLVVFLGVNTSVLHLGQPFKAWKAFLGWRRSWLSREILAFGAFLGAATGLVLLLWAKQIPLPLPIPGEYLSLPGLSLALEALTALLGMVSVFCSIMVYADTPRAFWFFPLTVARFLGTSLILGAAALAVFGDHLMLKICMGALAAKLLAEMIFNLVNVFNENAANHKPVRLLFGPLRMQSIARIALALAGILCWPVPLLAGILILMSELLERALFFKAAVAPRMPRGI